MKTWHCHKCKTTVQCAEEPSSRTEIMYSCPVPGEHNSFIGVKNTNFTTSANHHGPVCFGSERGENYYQHEWKKVS
jgi:hypothetical protein